MQKIQRIPEGESFGTAMARKYRPTTHSQEAEFAEEQREVEREAAETESRDLGKGGNVIQPAEPLRVMPKNNQWVWVVSFEEPNEAIYPVAHQFDRDCVISINLFQAGLCFPDSEAGKLGAELRAKMGILPPVDREELNEIFKNWEIEFPNRDVADSILHDFIESILEGGNDHE